MCASSLRKRLDRQAALPSVGATPAGLRSPTESSPLLSATTDALPSLDLSELQAQLEETETPSATTASLPDIRGLDENFDTAFQLAMNRGPLCAEPVIGMAYFLESVDLNEGDMSIEQGKLRAPARCRQLLIVKFSQSARSGRTLEEMLFQQVKMCSEMVCLIGLLGCSLLCIPVIFKLPVCCHPTASISFLTNFFD